MHYTNTLFTSLGHLFTNKLQVMLTTMNGDDMRTVSGS